jgi:cystathionine beta-lyase/cystathionine gamma-synthase
MEQRRPDLLTRLIHHPGGTCQVTGAVNFPIYEVSTFRQQAPGQNQGFDYSRTANPTRQVLEDYIADLEGGSAGFAFASGMAAITAALLTLRSGDHLIATQGLYGGSYRILTQVLQDYGISSSFVDTGDLQAVQAAFRDNTRAVFVETPSNPLMRVTDLREVARLADQRGIITIVDNTFLTPLLQRPLELGIDLVVYSATKFLGGHSDVVAGLVVTSREELAARLGHLQNAMGAIPSPMDCWLLMRGMKTLGVRLRQASVSAERIARWLAARPEVAAVYYPGLEDDAQVHRSQATGAGAVLSFRLVPEVNVDRFVSGLRLWTLAVSLGAVESIITVPARMTHLAYPEEERMRLGIDPHLVRLSVGLEAAEDLIADLEAGLQQSV